MAQRALQTTGDGAWDWNPQTGVAQLFDECKRILGYAPDEFPDDLREWMARVHPDDLAQVEHDLTAYYSGETASYRSEHRLRCKDGSWRCGTATQRCTGWRGRHPARPTSSSYTPTGTHLA
ncbi:MAG: PAS domain-containing protein [Xanthomonadales bacterium]|nr:PAS domain-containing protein [Xanthomonadales bacterium]